MNEYTLIHTEILRSVVESRESGLLDMFPYQVHVETIILMTYLGDKAKDEG